jgi:large subunit ribosomal protein L21
MQAIIETGGKQYRVAPGEVVRIGKVNGEVGSEIDIPIKALFRDGELVDAPSTLRAAIVNNGKTPKVLVFKFKRKKQYKKTIGHRQDFTEVRVGDIAV